jgi:putative transposase
MHVHLVFVTKYRREVFTRAILDDLQGIFASVCMRKKLWGGALWSPSYFTGSCGGAPIAIIRQYIEQQQTPH